MNARSAVQCFRCAYSIPGAATSKYAAATGSPKSYSCANFWVLNLARLAGAGTWPGT